MPGWRSSSNTRRARRWAMAMRDLEDCVPRFVGRVPRDFVWGIGLPESVIKGVSPPSYLAPQAAYPASASLFLFPHLPVKRERLAEHFPDLIWAFLDVRAALPGVAVFGPHPKINMRPVPARLDAEDVLCRDGQGFALNRGKRDPGVECAHASPPAEMARAIKAAVRAIQPMGESPKSPAPNRPPDCSARMGPAGAGVDPVL